MQIGESAQPVRAQVRTFDQSAGRRHPRLLRFFATKEP
jgi:hypothetical protein